MKLEFHHINVVSEDVDRLHDFYTRVLGLDDMPVEQFPRTEARGSTGYDGKIRFATEGNMQMHLAEKELDTAFRNGQVINPVERGHIAFRTSDLKGFIARLEAKGIPYSDWGHTAVAGWQQIFFYDPDGNVIEVHEVAE